MSSLWWAEKRYFVDRNNSLTRHSFSSPLSPSSQKKEFRRKKTGDDVQTPNIDIASPAQEMARQREVEEDGEEVTLLRRKRGGKGGEMRRCCLFGWVWPGARWVERIFRVGISISKERCVCVAGVFVARGMLSS